jgi:hypothetical protein
VKFERKSTYAPFKIIARLSDPIVYLDDLLHLDGLIAYGAYHDLDIRTRKTIPPIDGTDVPVDLTIPLSRWYVPHDPKVHGEVDPRTLRVRKMGAEDFRANGKDAPALWGWCCSAADNQAWELLGKVEVRKKPDLAAMAKHTDASTANIGAGHMKAYDLTFPTVFSRRVEWWCHGDMAETLRLLSSYVFSIGKKRNTGNGKVLGWSAEPMTEDWSVERDGMPMRRLPVGAIVDANGEPTGSVRHGAIRQPYYHRSRVVMAQEPC